MRGGERLVDECGWMSGICSGFYHLMEKSVTFSYRCPFISHFHRFRRAAESDSFPSGEAKGASFTLLPFNEPLYPGNERADAIRPYNSCGKLVPFNRRLNPVSYTVGACNYKAPVCKNTAHGGKNMMEETYTPE